MKTNPVIVTAAVLIVLSWLRYAQNLVVPFLLSLFIAVILAAPMGWMKRRGFHPAVAIGIIFAGLVGLGMLLAALLGHSFTAFSENLPAYQERLRQMANGALGWLSAIGVDVSHAAILKVVDPGAVMGFANRLVAALGDGLSHAFLILFTVFFMLLESWNLPKKFSVIGTEEARIALERIREVIESTKEYTSIKAVMSLVTGLLIWAGCSLIGLDFAVLWGFVAFLLNFIPTIGSIIAAVPAVLLAMVQLGPGPTLMVALLYLAVNTLIGNLIEPRYMGRRVGLSTLVVFLSMVFWGWLLGPVGMLLSVPLTMVGKFAAQANGKTAWVAVLLGPDVKEEKNGQPAVGG